MIGKFHDLCTQKRLMSMSGVLASTGRLLSSISRLLASFTVSSGVHMCKIQV